MTEENFTNGWIKVWHPSGVQVTLPLSLNELTSVDAASLVMRSVDNILAAGFQVNVPGLEDGELMEEISHIARREGGDQTPIIDFYSSNTKLEKKFLHVYLNTPDDITAFQIATDVLLDNMNVYDGQQAIERTNPKASKYVIALAHSIKVVYKISPKWEQWKQAGGEGKEPHKRMLVRYEVGKQAEKVNDSSPKAVSPEVTGAVGTDTNETQYKKLSGDLVKMIAKKTGFLPTEITPILSKIPSNTISFESALKLVTSNISKESA